MSKRWFAGEPPAPATRVEYVAVRPMRLSEMVVSVVSHAGWCTLALPDAIGLEQGDRLCIDLVELEGVRVITATGGPPHCSGCGRAAVPTEWVTQETDPDEYLLTKWREVGPLFAVCPACQAKPWANELALTTRESLEPVEVAPLTDAALDKIAAVLVLGGYDRCANCGHERSEHTIEGVCRHKTRNPRGTRFRCECEAFE